MPIETRWLASAPASCWHAVQAIATGATLVDRATAEALADDVEMLVGDLELLGLEQAAFFEHAVPLAAQFDAPGEWAKAVLARLVGAAPSPEVAARLARRYLALMSPFSRTNPQLLEQLELRVAPLMGQWEARGPGLMATVARLTEPDLIVEQADVIAVHPVLGGGGAAHWLNNSVRIEAVLANPIAELPEVLRLGWLLSQLHVDLPKYDANLQRDRRAEVWRLAMIPPVLAAGQEVELTRMSPATVSTAVTAWTENRQPSTPEVLHNWWDTYQQSAPSWPAALAALDRLLIGS